MNFITDDVLQNNTIIKNIIVDGNLWRLNKCVNETRNIYHFSKDNEFL